MSSTVSHHKQQQIGANNLMANEDQEEDGDEEEEDDEEEEEEEEQNLPIDCYVCHQSPAIYAPLGCKHRTLCKRCAMKQATGGKCKKCGQMFFQLKKH
ncbi:hypothetical protein O181_103453 [Austropuccinia psidii MF-1]|uniref:RING-type domain-containing protein n=1 Tax=Austropuccinia psidii MF-1 TaxID=1389203 RepID=A0A9Q3JIB3_9BASI|nr:hypothetical protein [Austropuccinia psidii MF-1]